MVGNVVQIAGLEIPGKDFKLDNPSAINAPVLPALIHASALCSDTALTASPIEDSCFFLKTLEGPSSSVIDRSECTHLTRENTSEPELASR
jgi:hypothetical protein